MSLGIANKTLTGAELNQLNEMATYARGSYLFNRSSGAEGIMGSYTGEDGKPKYVKMLTHSSERSVLKGQNAEANLITNNAKLKDASASLKQELLEFATKVGVDDKLKALFDGKKNKFETLMSRKIVAQAISLISNAHNKNRAAAEKAYRKNNDFATFVAKDVGEAFAWKKIANARFKDDTTIATALRDAPEPKRPEDGQPTAQKVNQKDDLPENIDKTKFKEVCDDLTCKFLLNMDPKNIKNYSRCTKGVVRNDDFKESIKNTTKAYKDLTGETLNYETDLVKLQEDVLTHRNDLYHADTLKKAQEEKNELKEAVNNLKNKIAQKVKSKEAQLNTELTALKKKKDTLVNDNSKALTDKENEIKEFKSKMLPIDKALENLDEYMPNGNAEKIKEGDKEFLSNLVGENVFKEMQDKVSSAVIAYCEKKGELPDTGKITGMEDLKVQDPQQEVKVEQQEVKVKQSDDKKDVNSEDLETKKTRLQKEIEEKEKDIGKDFDVKTQKLRIDFLDYLTTKCLKTGNDISKVVADVLNELKSFNTDESRNVQVTNLENRIVELNGRKTDIEKLNNEVKELNREIDGQQKLIDKRKLDFVDASNNLTNAKTNLENERKKLEMLRNQWHKGQIDDYADKKSDCEAKIRTYTTDYALAQQKFDTAKENLESADLYMNNINSVQTSVINRRQAAREANKVIDIEIENVRKEIEVVKNASKLSEFLEGNKKKLNGDGVNEVKNQAEKMLKDHEELVGLKKELDQVSQSIAKLNAGN